MHRDLKDRRISIAEIRFTAIGRIDAYLRERQGSRCFPARRDILPEELQFALGRIILLDVQGEPLDFIYRLYGSGISFMDRDEMTNRSVREVRPAIYRDMVVRHYTEAFNARAPVFHEIEVVAGGLKATYQRGLFPLSDDDSTINKLLSVGGWDNSLDRVWDAFIDADA